MKTIRLDLDGSQPGVDLRSRGPRIRIAVSHSQFRKFERDLHVLLGPVTEPELIVYGSGDFHHVSLALLRRVPVECNLLVLDLHPDWMRGVPMMHCGTWLAHALPSVRRVFHVGGDLDFDNGYRWFAPWSAIRTGRVIVCPARRRFDRGRWRKIPQEIVADLRKVVRANRADLASRPLYISLDKDVMRAEDAVVNWEPGHLRFDDVANVITEFVAAADGRVAGMDVTGDWSPVVTQGWLRGLLDRTEHPKLNVDPHRAAEINSRTNADIVRLMESIAGGPT